MKVKLLLNKRKKPNRDILKIWKKLRKSMSKLSKRKKNRKLKKRRKPRIKQKKNFKRLKLKLNWQKNNHCSRQHSHPTQQLPNFSNN
jgi:hypothetical protein